MKKINYNRMPNRNSCTYMDNQQVLSNKFNEMGINNYNSTSVLYQIVVKQNAWFTKSTLTVPSLDIKKCETHVKQYLKIISENIKICSTISNIKMIGNYQKFPCNTKNCMKNYHIFFFFFFYFFFINKT